MQESVTQALHAQPRKRLTAFVVGSAPRESEIGLQSRLYRQHRSPYAPDRPEPNEPRGSPPSSPVKAQVHLVQRRAELHDQPKLSGHCARALVVTVLTLPARDPLQAIEVLYRDAALTCADQAALPPVAIRPGDRGPGGAGQAGQLLL